MYFLHIVFVVVCILFLRIQNVKAQAGAEEQPDPDPAPGDPEQKDPEQDSAEYYEDRLAHVDSHTFVVLIDTTRNEEIQPELTMSFVILGTKQMFDSGYESYLPIERIETHPNFKGWTADLAIVFTFAGMVTEKHGTVVPLAGERSSTPVDSNVTVFSWGHCNEGTSKTGPVYQGKQTAYPPTGDNEEEDSGAPALQHGKLVAVTVGGVESNGEHVAVGMKMSCFCSWIVETLPMYEEVVKIKCCKNCCGVKNGQAQETNNKQEETDQLPYKPGGRGKSNQRYRVADIDDIDENQYADQSRKKRYQ